MSPVETTWIVHLDPSAVVETPRYELDLNADPLRVDQRGIDWGDAAITAYMADQQQWGSNVINFRVPNRIVKIPMFLLDTVAGDGSGEVGRAQLQQKVALIQREGGWLLRQRVGGAPMYADVVNATLTLPDQWLETGGVQPDVLLTLECLPDFYGDVITLDSVTVSATGNGYYEGVLLQSGSTAMIKGDHPGRVQITIGNSSANQNGMLWGFRSMNYSSAPSAALVIEAEDLVLDSPTAVYADTSAAGGHCAGTSFVQTFWTPMLEMTLAADSGTPLTHTGVYEVWARVKCDSDTQPRLRLLWGQGSLASPVANDFVIVPHSAQWYLLDIGQVRLVQPAFGDTQWFGQLQVYAPSAIDGSLFVDEFIFLPLDESAGQLAYNPLPTPSSTIWAFDNFSENTTGSAVSLTGKTAQVGGNWSGAGSTDDAELPPGTGSGPFTAVPYAYRNAAGDNQADWGNSGRFNLLGPSNSGVIVTASLAPALFTDPASSGVSVEPGSDSLNFIQALILRYIDTNNFLAVGIQNTGADISGNEIWELVIWKVNGGSVTALYGPNAPGGGQESQSIINMINGLSAPPDGVGSGLPSNPMELSARCSLGGVLQVLINNTLVLTLSDPDLIQGAALGTGAAGIYSFNGSSDIAPMYFQQFLVQAMTSDAVLFADAELILSTQGMYQVGAGFSPISNVIGDMPRIPPSGLEARPCELLIRPTQGDFNQIQDTQLGGFTVQVKYRPTWLFRP